MIALIPLGLVVFTVSHHLVMDEAWLEEEINRVQNLRAIFQQVQNALENTSNYTKRVDSSVDYSSRALTRWAQILARSQQINSVLTDKSWNGSSMAQKLIDLKPAQSIRPNLAPTQLPEKLPTVPMTCRRPVLNSTTKSNSRSSLILTQRSVRRRTRVMESRTPQAGNAFKKNLPAMRSQSERRRTTALARNL